MTCLRSISRFVVVFITLAGIAAAAVPAGWIALRYAPPSGADEKGHWIIVKEPAAGLSAWWSDAELAKIVANDPDYVKRLETAWEPRGSPRGRCRRSQAAGGGAGAVLGRRRAPGQLLGARRDGAWRIDIGGFPLDTGRSDAANRPGTLRRKTGHPRCGARSQSGRSALRQPQRYRDLRRPLGLSPSLRDARSRLHVRAQQGAAAASPQPAARRRSYAEDRRDGRGLPPGEPRCRDGRFRELRPFVGRAPSQERDLRAAGELCHQSRSADHSSSTPAADADTASPGVTHSDSSTYPNPDACANAFARGSYPDSYPDSYSDAGDSHSGTCASSCTKTAAQAEAGDSYSGAHTSGDGVAHANTHAAPHAGGSYPRTCAGADTGPIAGSFSLSEPANNSMAVPGYAAASACSCPKSRTGDTAAASSASTTAVSSSARTGTAAVLRLRRWRAQHPGQG